MVQILSLSFASYLTLANLLNSSKTYFSSVKTGIKRVAVKTEIMRLKHSAKAPMCSKSSINETY